MVGGNIAGETRTISIAIYDRVEMLDYGAAHLLSAILLVFAFFVLLAMYVVNYRSPLARTSLSRKAIGTASSSSRRTTRRSRSTTSGCGAR
jgi:ABC-type Fe3+ transport system permease subunit